MNRLTRSTALKIAAVIAVASALFGLIMYDLPGLMAGQAAVNQIAEADGSGPPFFMVLLGAAFNVLAIVGAYGAWHGQRWGVVLLIITSAFNMLSSMLGALHTGAATTRAIGAVGVVLQLAVLTLCLWRERKPLAV